ncbi:unnamed protein product, partial [Porites evermanni]
LGENTDVKSEPASPDEDSSRAQFVDSQDEENDVFVAKEQRRFAHSAAEQKRRDAIRKGYDDLQTIVPTCHQPNTAPAMQKLSKAIILQKSIEYIIFLHQQKKKQEEELEALRKEVMALKIMKTNYEQIAKAHQNQPAQGQKQVPDQAKFSVFRQIMETQFLSFNASVTVTNFETLSACIFSWLEEYCKPQVSDSSNFHFTLLSKVKEAHSALRLISIGALYLKKLIYIKNFHELLHSCWVLLNFLHQYLQEIVINALKNLNNQGLLQQ